MKYMKIILFIVMISMTRGEVARGAMAQKKEEVGDFKRAKFIVKKVGEKIIIEQKGNIYEYPTSKKEYAGIKKVERKDLNGDGIPEYIIAAQLQETEISYPNGKKTELPMSIYGTILICEAGEDELFIAGQMSPGKLWPAFKFIDLDNDGLEDVLGIGYTYGHWQQIQICSWQNGRYVYLWNKGGGQYATEHTYSVNKDGIPQIKIGYPTPAKGKKKQDYVIDEWVIWVWDGSQFVAEEGEE